MENDMKTKRKGYMSVSQKEQLIELLTEEHALRSGKFSQSFTKQVADAKWNTIANKLNSIPGGKKNAQEWKRAWADLKTKTKGKNFQIKKYSNKTGGGPSCSTHLNETDDKILSLINPTTITGHIGIAESNVRFSFPGESNFETIADEIAIEGNEIRIEENTTIIDDYELNIEDYEINIDSQYIEPIDNNINVITVQNMSTLPFEQEKRLDISEQDKIQDSVANEYPKKSQKRRSMAAVRLQKSVTATEQLVEIAKQKLAIKKNYYDKKIQLLEQKNQLLLRQLLASEKHNNNIL